jgi:hypothetical protein
LHTPKPAQELEFPFLCHPGALIQHTLRNPPFHEKLMVPVGKPMGFVPDPLHQPQRTALHWKSQGIGLTGPVNFLKFLRQTHNRQVVKAQPLQLPTRGSQLAFTAVHNHKVREPG